LIDSDQTFIIAEAGVNHNGSPEMARRLIEVAVEAGADAVKFQSFRAEQLASATAPKAAYQNETTDAGESQLEMLRALELSVEQHDLAAAHCHENGIQFLSTPFDEARADLLVNRFDVPVLKVPSGEITNGPLLLHVARTQKPVILSTGMSTLGEVEKALQVLAFGYTHENGSPDDGRLRDVYASDKGQHVLLDKVTLLQCTTEYPAPAASVNLRAMDTMRAAFGLPVGLSDHTQGIEVAIAAVACGAKVIEKHFTLDRTLPGPDHAASLEPGELKQMIRSIRNVERALGSGRKHPSAAEKKNISVARKRLVAGRAIAAGERFSEGNLTAKRPGDGLSPMRYWALLGTEASKHYAPDDPITE